jgi:hypothetical protein
LNKKILNYEEYIKKSSNTSKDYAKAKNIIIGEIVVDKSKIAQKQMNSLSKSTDKAKYFKLTQRKDEMILKNNNVSSSQLNRRLLEKKSSMEVKSYFLTRTFLIYN